MLNTHRKLDNRHMVLVPQNEYEKFLLWKKSVKEFKASPAEKRALARARRNYVADKTITLDELKHALDIRD